MSTAARRRLMRDFQKLQKDPPPGIQAAPLDNNIMVSFRYQLNCKQKLYYPDQFKNDYGIY